jgi:RNA polymerase sigma-70 factor (ECF subfamily)
MFMVYITSAKEDAKFIVNYIDGSESALEFLIKKHQHRLFNFIYSKVLNKDIADDIFQDTFIKVIKTLKRGVYNEEGKFLPWMMRIAHNLVIDHFRKQNRIPLFESNDNFDIFQLISDGSLNAENAIINDQIVADLQKIILELPEDQKKVLLMRFYRDMSFKEISNLTGVSINTALGRMRYAIINLRKLIESHKISLTR